MVKNTCFQLIASAVLLFTVGTSRGFADRPDFLVNDDGGRTEQSHPRVAVAGDGSFVIVWTDRRAGIGDIYLQRFSADAQPVQRNVKVNDEETDAYQAEPAVAVDLSGLYSAVWKDYRNGTYPFGPDIYFQRYDSSVTAVDSNRNLTAPIPDSLKETPDISLSPFGEGVVVWADYRNRNWDIYAQRISSSGSLLGDNIRVNNDAGTAQQHSPRVSVSPDGWFVVTWYDNRLGNDDIWVQRFDSLGLPLGANVRVNSDTQGKRQAFPDIAADGAGNFIVVWVDWRNGNYPVNPDIYFRKFDTSMTALSAERKINTDIGTRAQREPSISVDRTGHAAVVWADSTAGSWDITGQMIDADGVLRGSNFRANSLGDSAQFHPDVAVDGRRRYVAWTDKRNGNYDIYAAVSTYNDPTLTPSPTALKFQTEQGGATPASQSLVITHSGYNSLDFEVLSSDSWLTVSPSGGTTPDTVSVSVNASGLSYGTYFGALTLIDVTSNDSSVVVSVRFDVTAPVMAIADDTVHMTAFAGADDIQSARVDIRNEGSGSFTWQASAGAEWITLPNPSGSSNSFLTITAGAQTLAAGVYLAPVQITADAIGSPDTVWVRLEAVDNLPYLDVEPDSIHIHTSRPDTVVATAVVHNAGAGALNWTAETSAPWILLTPGGGQADDSMLVSIDTSGLAVGSHTATIVVTDSSAFNVSDSVIVTLAYYELSGDTVRFGNLTVASGGQETVPVELDLVNGITAITIPAAYDTSVITVDSITLAASMQDVFTAQIELRPDSGFFVIELSPVAPDTFLAKGTHLLAQVAITAAPIETVTYIDTLSSEIRPASITLTSGETMIPWIVPGELTISTPTGVNDTLSESTTGEFVLSQNYPNPFNQETVIRFELPTGAFVELAVYNILGQKVRSLVADRLPAGSHTAFWDGTYDNGRSVPSGMYFYRLQTERMSAVKKMVLLK